MSTSWVASARETLTIAWCDLRWGEDAKSHRVLAPRCADPRSSCNPNEAPSPLLPFLARDPPDLASHMSSLASRAFSPVPAATRACTAFSRCGPTDGVSSHTSTTFSQHATCFEYKCWTAPAASGERCGSRYASVVRTALRLEGLGARGGRAVNSQAKCSSSVVASEWLRETTVRPSVTPLEPPAALSAARARPVLLPCYHG